jgi:hypothetical protein
MNVHPDDTNYPILRATARDDGEALQDFIDTVFGTPFKVQENVSQDGLAICIDDALGLDNWGSYASTDPRWNQFKFNGVDRPSYLPGNCHRISYAAAKAITKIRGASGSAWRTL